MISKDAERLAHEISIRTQEARISVFAFRGMGQLGLPHAKNQEAQTWEESFKRGFARAEELAAFSGQKDSFDRFCEDQVKQLTEKSVTAFEAALDAASLIFSHSLLDTAAFDWCRVCALACPDDFMPYIANRQFSLAEVQATSFSELREKAIGRHLEKLERKSLLKKLDVLFALCHPPPSFSPSGFQNYSYDRKRIVDLDTLRHDYVHRGWVGGRLPQGDDDLVFLSNTTTFLFHLVTQRYGIRLDPDVYVAALKTNAARP
jgi:hypothetical protein